MKRLKLLAQKGAIGSIGEVTNLLPEFYRAVKAEGIGFQILDVNNVTVAGCRLVEKQWIVTAYDSGKPSKAFAFAFELKHKKHKAKFIPVKKAR